MRKRTRSRLKMRSTASTSARAGGEVRAAHAAALVPSSTEGHYHLYIDHPMTWDAYRHLLEALVVVGIVQPGYLHASESRGYAALRVPWLHKESKESRY
ncbi:hypothetical protein ACFRAQ_24375 [Nocardia sp. NPDC056611]|uniref:hypothetical protein n=1 Tax=Nocardia sp. NPDC056611 TaxID=3345877 RepID=UPI00367301E4